MDPTQVVAVACDHQTLVVEVLSGALGIPALASAAAWANARWQKLPPIAQRVLQVLALNFLHAALGEPTAPQPGDQQ